MVKKEKNIRVAVRVTPRSPKLFDVLSASGPYYAGKTLVRLAEIGLAFEEGRIQIQASDEAPNPIIVSKPATSRKGPRSSSKSQTKEPAAKPHYKVAVGSPAAEAMASMFPDD